MTPPIRAAVSAPVPVSRALAANGAPQAASAPVMPAPVTETAQPEEAISWGALVAENGATSLPSDPPHRAARKGPVSSTLRVGGLPPAPAQNYGLAWIVGIASGIVLVLVVLGGILAWALGKKTETGEADRTGPLVLFVNRLGTNDSFSSIAAAVAKVRGRGKHPAHIVVQEDLAESGVLVDLPNLSIEAEAGKAIHWKPSSKSGASSLLTVYKAEGFHLKGFTLDGDNRIDKLVYLGHHCPGVRLEDLTLQGFKKYGIQISSCEGGPSPEKHVVLQRLTFVTDRQAQTDLFFSIEDFHKDAIPTNKYFIVRDCTFEGPGTKVKTPDRTTLDHIEFPPGIQPVQGP